MATSSARPDRLTRFEALLGTMADAVRTRTRSLDGAISTFHHSCSPSYRPWLGDLPDALTAALDGLDTLGTWTGDVGRAFLAADAVEAYMRGGGSIPDGEEVRTRSDDELLAVFADRWDDPFLGAPAVGFPPGTGDPADEPPSWLDLASEAGSDLDVVSAFVQIANGIDELPAEWTIEIVESTRMIRVLSNGVVLEEFTETRLLGRLLVPGTAPAGRVAFVKWAGRAGNVLTFAVAAGESWHADTGSDTGERLARAVVRGGGVAGGAIAGAWAGGGAGTFCGPAAVVCVPVLAVGGGIAGAFGMDWFMDQIPWLQPDVPLPLEYDLDEVTSTIVDAGLSPADELAAWEAAAGDLTGTVYGPDLEAALDDATGDLAVPQPRAQPSAMPPTGTTTTTAPPEPVPGPAPSPSPSPSGG